MFMHLWDSGKAHGFAFFYVLPPDPRPVDLYPL